MNDKKEIKESPIEYKIIKKIIKFTLKNQNFEFFINNNIIFCDLDFTFLILIKLFFFRKNLKIKQIYQMKKVI